jgi:hypothetical protein
VATSKVPAALDALVSIFGAASGLSGVTVVDGPPVGDQSDQDYLYVGWQFDAEGGAGVEARQDFNAAGARTRDEDFDILCQLDSWTGDTDVSARRARAFVLLAAVEDAIRATVVAPTAPTLNNAVLWAHLTQHSLIQQHTDSGVQVGIKFRISCRARI